MNTLEKIQSLAIAEMICLVFMGVSLVVLVFTSNAMFIFAFIVLFVAANFVVDKRNSLMDEYMNPKKKP